MTRLLYSLASQGTICWLSYYFAEFIATRARADIDDWLALTAALACEAQRNGDVCVDLARAAGQPVFASAAAEAAAPLHAPPLEAWRKTLLASNIAGDPGASTPLILEADRLYLNRYWHYEVRVASGILDLLKNGPAPVDAARIDALLAPIDTIDDDQKNAVRTAVRHRFSVISGGPGSGKTSTVIRILALLLELDPDYRIALAAPTGRAAARMLDSIRERADRSGLDADLRRALPAEASTIHRLLGYRRNGFVYGSGHPLPFDCVVIDEASMVDLRLMYHLLCALPRHGRLILLGDRDQLASVAAGNVLGDITGHGYRLRDNPGPVAASIALLGGNYRFGRDSVIGELAQRVNRGDSDGLLERLRSGDSGLCWYPADETGLHADALAWIRDAYSPIFDSASASAALEIYASTRILCATNHGAGGVDALNDQISRMLLAHHRLPETDLYGGMPIMITRNRHELGLYNGDTGILWRYPQGLRACFREQGGGVRDLAVNRLPDFVPAWASTVHKSQGSEYDSVMLLLPPDPDSEALSRELVYTAITRARRHFSLHAGPEAVTSAIARLTRRYSGLATRLGWPSDGRGPA